MFPHIHDLLPAGSLSHELQNGYVRRQSHPTQPYHILNYTEKTQFERRWNPVTRTCRGLIVNWATGEVVARPFPKFFNYGEEAAGMGRGRFSSDEPVVVTDKMDGSLGILYPLLDGGHAVATRGSFESEQAWHATELFDRKYAGRWRPQPGKTVLFEIVYPGNRIVVDYGDTDDLVLLGMVDIRTGITYGPQALPSWPGPKARVFDYPSLDAAFRAAPRSNAEGLVVHFPYSDTRVKLKQDDYIALHKVRFGLDERDVWERLRTMPIGGQTEHLYGGIPDEFHAWVEQVADRIYSDHDDHEWMVDDAWDRLDRDGLLPPPPNDLALTRDQREAFALAAQSHPKWLQTCLFARLDGNEQLVQQIVWDFIKPPAGRKAAPLKEDTA